MEKLKIGQRFDVVEVKNTGICLAKRFGDMWFTYLNGGLWHYSNSVKLIGSLIITKVK